MKFAEGRICQQGGIKYLAVAFLVLKRDHVDRYYVAPARAAALDFFFFFTKNKGDPEFMTLYIQLTQLPAVFLIEMMSSGLPPAHKTQTPRQWTISPNVNI